MLAYSDIALDISGQEAAIGLVVNEDCAFTTTYQDVLAGTCPWVITRTYTVTDECLNVTQIAHTITIDDTTAPVLTAPADEILEACDVDTGLAAAGLLAYSDIALDLSGLHISRCLRVDEGCAFSTTYQDILAAACPRISTRTYIVRSR